MAAPTRNAFLIPICPWFNFISLKLYSTKKTTNPNKPTDAKEIPIDLSTSSSAAEFYAYCE